MRKAEDKEKAATVEANNKVKEESLAVAGGRCWKRVLLRALKNTGELNIFHGLEDKIALCFPQRLGSCPASPFSSLWSTQPSPFTSTWMANFFDSKLNVTFSSTYVFHLYL